MSINNMESGLLVSKLETIVYRSPMEQFELVSVVGIVVTGLVVGATTFICIILKSIPFKGLSIGGLPTGIGIVGPPCMPIANSEA